jgi:hypothetical protein
MILNIMEFLGSYQNELSIVLTLFSLIGGAISWFFALRSKRSEAKLAKDLEKYKHELQSDYMKTELRTKQLFIKYPEMFALFQQLYGELYRLRRAENRSGEIRQDEIAKCQNNEFYQANNYLALNLLFFSSEVRDLAIKLKDSMITCLFSKTKEEGTKNLENVTVLLDKLEKQMKSELGH